MVQYTVYMYLYMYSVYPFIKEEFHSSVVIGCTCIQLHVHVHVHVAMEPSNGNANDDM